MPLIISRNDITKIDVDAIVNAANNQLKMGGGVCGAIFRAAGSEKLQASCDNLSPIKTGQAVITPGFDSKAKFIIHTAGPIYQEGNTIQEQQLYDCYFNSLKLAADKKLNSIAFPLISSGIYGYPTDKALNTALKSIHDFLGEYDGQMIVYMIVFKNDAFIAAQKLYGDIQSYIDENYVDKNLITRSSHSIFSNIIGCSAKSNKYTPNFSQEQRAIEKSAIENDIFADLEDSFNKLLFKYIKEKKMTNADVYKNANIDRRLFSKIISHKDYTPSKNTIFALAISLKLDIKQTETLLRSAGYAISHSSKSDLIIEYYITRQDTKNYNIDDLNFLLFKYNLTQLGQV